MISVHAHVVTTNTTLAMPGFMKIVLKAYRWMAGTQHRRKTTAVHCHMLMRQALNYRARFGEMTYTVSVTYTASKK